MADIGYPGMGVWERKFKSWPQGNSLSGGSDNQGGTRCPGVPARGPVTGGFSGRVTVLAAFLQVKGQVGVAHLEESVTARLSFAHKFWLSPAFLPGHLS